MKRELNGKKHNAVGQSDVKCLSVCLSVLHLRVLADVSPSLTGPNSVLPLHVPVKSRFCSAIHGT